MWAGPSTLADRTLVLLERTKTTVIHTRESERWSLTDEESSLLLPRNKERRSFPTPRSFVTFASVTLTSQRRGKYTNVYLEEVHNLPNQPKVQCMELKDGWRDSTKVLNRNGYSGSCPSQIPALGRQNSKVHSDCVSDPSCSRLWGGLKDERWLHFIVNCLSGMREDQSKSDL